MPSINFQDRQIIFSRQDFEAENIDMSIIFLAGIMLYPDTFEDIVDFLHGINFHFMSCYTHEELSYIYKNNSDQLAMIFRKEEKIKNKFNTCWFKPHKGLNRLEKGVIAGDLASCLFSLNNMSEVYAFIEKIKNHYRQRLATYKRKTFEEIWNTYRHSAHLWWAYNKICLETKNYLFPAVLFPKGLNPTTGTSTTIKSLLSVATIIRKIIVEKKDTKSVIEDDYQIKDPKKVWSILDTDNSIPKCRSVDFTATTTVVSTLPHEFN